MMFNRSFVARCFLVVALVFGGGGSPSPLTELIIEIAALVALATFYSLAPARSTEPARPDWLLLAGAVALAAIPVIQLIPLPPAIWHALPGRAPEIASLSLIGQQDSWRPLSLSPYTTFASLLSLIPPLAMVAMVRSLALDERFELIKVAAGVAVLAAILGVFQIIGDSHHWLRFYEHTHYGFATGFDANRNADADLLLVGLIGVSAIIAHQRRHNAPRMPQLAALTIMIFLIISVFATGSRTGVTLLLIALICCAAILWPTVKVAVRKRIAVVVAAFAIAGAGGVVLLNHNALIGKTVDRFSASADARLSEIWPDTLYVIQQHFPVGTGMGTFTPVFKAGERLEVVNPSVPNRAHNDYLEFTLEAGLLAIGLLGFVLVAGYWRGIAIIVNARSARHRDQAILAVGALAIFWLHSLVDYPMRAMALATIAALAVGVLSFHPARQGGGRRHG